MNTAAHPPKHARAGIARVLGAVAAACVIAAASHAQEWNNTGGTSLRNGLSTARGPLTATVAWNAPEFSLIAWSPVVDAGRVFYINQTGFPTNNGAAGDVMIAKSLATGAELWRTSLPFSGNTSTNWTAWIAGARDGRVYAARSGNGASVAAPLRAHDAATGAFLWQSAATIRSGPYDGVVFAPNGDLIVADFSHVTRIRATDGATVWRVTRVGSVSGNCGAAATASAVFIVDAVNIGGTGHVVRKLDIATGAFLYRSDLMPGFTAQNTPFLSRDGQTVYFARTQNNPPVDLLYAWRDTGTALVPLWNRPVRWTTSHEHGVGPDGSIYTFLPDNSFVRLDPVTGNVTNTAGVLPTFSAVNLSPKTAVDSSGVVYVANGWAGSPATNGRLWAFRPDLAQTFFTLTLDNPNQGAPALASDGTLIVNDRNGLRGYRAARCLADMDVDGDVELDDFFAFLNAFDDTDITADLDNVPGVDLSDFFTFLGAFDQSC